MKWGGFFLCRFFNLYRYPHFLSRTFAWILVGAIMSTHVVFYDFLISCDASSLEASFIYCLTGYDLFAIKKSAAFIYSVGV